MILDFDWWNKAKIINRKTCAKEGREVVKDDLCEEIDEIHVNSAKSLLVRIFVELMRFYLCRIQKCFPGWKEPKKRYSVSTCFRD